MADPRAAVDVGSNSVRLLIVDAAGERILREMRITRLAAGVDATGHLDDAALERTLAAIEMFRDLWVAAGVTDRVRIAATSAVRDAADRDRFFEGVRRVTGHQAQVISGEEEAALAFAGAAGAVEVASPIVVLDIGGGSTELTVGDRPARVRSSVSLQLGCVRLTERCLFDDPPTPSQLERAREFVREQLDHADRVFAGQQVQVSDAAALVGVAGTVTTLGALHLGLESYDEDRIHGATIPQRALRDLTARLAGLTSRERAKLGPMQPGREDVIHGGALILNEVVERYDFEAVVVSESDNLDGLAASLA